MLRTCTRSTIFGRGFLLSRSITSSSSSSSFSQQRRREGGGKQRKEVSISGLLSELEVLQTNLVRREGSPEEIKAQARFLLSSDEILSSLKPTCFSSHQVPAFAMQVSALLSSSNSNNSSSKSQLPSVHFYESLSEIFTFHLSELERKVLSGGYFRPSQDRQQQQHRQLDDDNDNDLDHHHHHQRQEAGRGREEEHGNCYSFSAPKLCSSIIECIVSFCGDYRSLKNLPHQDLAENLSQAQTLSLALLQREAPRVSGLREAALLRASTSSSSSSSNSSSLFSNQQHNYHSSSSSSSSAFSSFSSVTSTPQGQQQSQMMTMMMMNKSNNSNNLSTKTTGGGGGGGRGGAGEWSAASSAYSPGTSDAPFWSVEAAKSDLCTPRHVLAFIRASDILLGGPQSFKFASHRGVPPLVFLPIKAKLDMERKALKHPILRELLRELERRLPQLTRIDAHVCLKTLAVVGLFSQEVVDTCVDRITVGLGVSSSHIQLAEAILHLGVLGHRHISVRSIISAIDTSEIGAVGMRKLLRGMTMLQLPLRHPTSSSSSSSCSSSSSSSFSPSPLLDDEEALVKKIHDHVWMYALRRDSSSSSASSSSSSSSSKTSIAWHIDVAHALVSLKAPHYQFVLRTCRIVRKESQRIKAKHHHEQQQQHQQKGGTSTTAGKEDNNNSNEKEEEEGDHFSCCEFLSPLQQAQLLWTLGKIDRRQVPQEFSRDWVKVVNRVKKTLANEALKTVNHHHNHNDHPPGELDGERNRLLLLQGLEAVSMSPTSKKDDNNN